MNWTKIGLSAVVGGVLMWLTDFVQHGILLGDTYVAHPDVFSQTQTNPVYFLAISVAITFFAALLFAKTRDCWPAGWKGGAKFGFFVGLVLFFGNFIYPLVIDGFPYFLGWCWGGTALIAMTVAGIGIGLIQKG